MRFADPARYGIRYNWSVALADRYGIVRSTNGPGQFLL